MTCKCASRHNGVQFFIFHLPRCLRTRRFSEPTFRPSGATKHWKNTVFCDFPTFSRTCICSLLTFFISELLPLLTAFFISPYCRKFSFQTSFDNICLIFAPFLALCQSPSFVLHDMNLAEVILALQEVREYLQPTWPVCGLCGPDAFAYVFCILYYQVVPHRAVAEVSKIGNL